MCVCYAVLILLQNTTVGQLEHELFCYHSAYNYPA